MEAEELEPASSPTPRTSQPVFHVEPVVATGRARRRPRVTLPEAQAPGGERRRHPGNSVAVERPRDQLGHGHTRVLTCGCGSWHRTSLRCAAPCATRAGQSPHTVRRHRPGRRQQRVPTALQGHAHQIGQGIAGAQTTSGQVRRSTDAQRRDTPAARDTTMQSSVRLRVSRETWVTNRADAVRLPPPDEQDDVSASATQQP